jgi:hypothetical protein
MVTNSLPNERDFACEQPRYWASPAQAIAFDAFSLMFPAAECFMIRAAQEAHDRLDDPELKRALAMFVRQEATHARLHAAYNRAMDARGFSASSIEAANAAVIGALESRIGLRRRLAASAGLEHFTALIAESIVSDPRLLDGADPRYAALWRWHAREEIEHKAVAFDLHAALYPRGAWVSRTRAFVASVLILLFLFWSNVWRLAGDSWERSRLRTMLDIVWFVFGAPGLFRHIMLATLAYLRPGFHPVAGENDLLAPAAA